MNDLDKFDELRRKAEEFIEQGDDGDRVPRTDFLELIHELKIHQIELEIQNEELLRAQEEISLLQREFTDLYEFAPCGYITLSPKGTIKRINLHGSVLLHTDRTPLRRMTLSSFIAPESNHDYFLALKQAGKTGEKQVLELKLQWKAHGDPIWVRSDIQADRDETGNVVQWRLTLLDITEQRRKESELKIAHSQLFTILESLDAGVIVFSRKTEKILFANHYIQQLFQPEMIGSKYTEFLHYSSEDTQDGVFEYQIPDAGKWFLIRIHPMLWVDDTEAIINILSDITPIKEAERLKEDIERIIRHDLRSPIIGMVSGVRLLTDTETHSEEASEYLTMIGELGRKVLLMIDQSLDLFRMENGTYKVKLEKFGIKDLLENIKKEFNGQILQKQLTVTINWKTPLSFSTDRYIVQGEYLLCYQIFSNLIKNAIEASTAGDSVHISIAWRKPDMIDISISNGKALPKEITRFGEKYSTFGKSKGLGLGVYSAALMTRIQGGSFQWTSSEEEGTTITLSLPAADALSEKT